MNDPFAVGSFRAAASHRCPECGYAVFQGEPCAVCANPHLFLGTQEPPDEFYAVLTLYRESVPYRYAGTLSELFELLRRRLARAEKRLTTLEVDHALKS
jgi:hypothetical protein